ncbi:MAG: hypothetical protein ACT4OP_11370 [Actinomycetota bacterium]
MTDSLNQLTEAGRAASNRHDWKEAYELLIEADRTGDLSGEGLKLLGEVSFWSGHVEETVSHLERAYGAYLKQGDSSSAAMMAYELARQYAMRLIGPTSGSWFAQAERLVADDPDSPVHGYLECMKGFMALTMQGDAEQAITHIDRALEIAARTRDRNVYGMGLEIKGWALSMQGKLTEALAMMDEAMVAAVGGEMDPAPTGEVYCSMIGMCASRGDYKRSAEWSDATLRWCERNAISGFPGICRVHRAELLRIRGAWLDAEREVRRAMEELLKFKLLMSVGDAHYELGEIRLRMGDFASAEQEFGLANEMGRDPQPGLSLLQLNQDKIEAAVGGLKRLLAANPKDRLSRVKPLATAVKAFIASGDVDAAEAAAEELESIAEEVGTTAFKAHAAQARGSVLLARNQAEQAIGRLRAALRGWQEVEAPYEAAEVRVLVARSYQELGDVEAAALELRSARDAFERLGAAWAAEQAGGLLGEVSGFGATSERVRRAMMFTDIVKSTDLAGAIGDEAWEQLLSWHDQKLRSVFASHGGEVVHHTGDGFFVTYADATAAMAGAVAVQRALADHRRETGFALPVRIGVHVAEATRRGGDFGGVGVHKAARVAAQAAGWEIMASEEALSEAGGNFPIGEFRVVELKGIPEPSRVAPVEWRSATKG